MTATPGTTQHAAYVQGQFEWLARMTREALEERAALRSRMERMEAWMADAEIALKAATTIGTREGAHLNYGNHDRLLAELAALDAEPGA